MGMRGHQTLRTETYTPRPHRDPWVEGGFYKMDFGMYPHFGIHPVLIGKFYRHCAAASRISLLRFKV